MLYEGATREPVATFLAAHPRLIVVLVESAPPLRTSFGVRPNMRLEPPPLVGGKLTVRVSGHCLPPDEAAVREACFNAWWILTRPEHGAARRWLEVRVE